MLLEVTVFFFFPFLDCQVTNSYIIYKQFSWIHVYYDHNILTYFIVEIIHRFI